MNRDSKVYLMSINLSGIHKDDDVQSSIQSKGTLSSLDDANRLRIFRVFLCDGLVLCITIHINFNSMHLRLVVWNPCCGKTRWIEPRASHKLYDYYALGYERKSYSGSHKILRFLKRDGVIEFEIYNLDSNSWKVVELTLNGAIHFYQRCVSLKGNTYWLAREEKDKLIPAFLLCFDFTTERFGPRLPLPFEHRYEDTVTISSVREEQLAMLFQSSVTDWTEIWISNKINPNSVSWSKLFLKFHMRKMPASSANFFVDQKKKVAVVLDKKTSFLHNPRNIAYIIGEDGYFKQVDLGESSYRFWFHPLMCSYVPNSVQVQQPEAQGKRKMNQISD